MEIVKDFSKYYCAMIELTAGQTDFIKASTQEMLALVNQQEAKIAAFGSLVTEKNIKGNLIREDTHIAKSLLKETSDYPVIKDTLAMKIATLEKEVDLISHTLKRCDESLTAMKCSLINREISFVKHMDALTEEAKEITNMDYAHIKVLADIHDCDANSMVCSKVCTAAEALLLRRILTTEQPPALKSMDITPHGLGIMLDLSNPKKN
jgi:hypothetical protein